MHLFASESPFSPAFVSPSRAGRWLTQEQIFPPWWEVSRENSPKTNGWNPKKWRFGSDDFPFHFGWNIFRWTSRSFFGGRDGWFSSKNLSHFCWTVRKTAPNTLFKVIFKKIRTDGWNPIPTQPPGMLLNPWHNGISTTYLNWFAGFQPSTVVKVLGHKRLVCAFWGFLGAKYSVASGKILWRVVRKKIVSESPSGVKVVCRHVLLKEVNHVVAVEVFFGVISFWTPGWALNFGDILKNNQNHRHGCQHHRPLQSQS